MRSRMAAICSSRVRVGSSSKSSRGGRRGACGAGRRPIGAGHLLPRRPDGVRRARRRTGRRSRARLARGRRASLRRGFRRGAGAGRRRRAPRCRGGVSRGRGPGGVSRGCGSRGARRWGRGRGPRGAGRCRRRRGRGPRGAGRCRRRRGGGRGLRAASGRGAAASGPRHRRGLRPGHLHRHALDDGVEGRDGHPFARRESALHQDVLGRRAQDVDLPVPQPAVVVDNQHLVAPVQRRPRQHHHVVDAPTGYLRLHEHPHRQGRPGRVGARRVRIVDLGHHVDHPAHGVDLALGPHDPPPPGIAPPREVRRQGDGGAGLLLRTPVGHRHVDVGQLVVGQGQPDLGRVDRVDPPHRGTAVHELPDVDVLRLDPPGVGGAHLGALQVPPCAVDRRLGGSHRGPGVLDLRLAQGEGGGVALADFLPLAPGHLGLRLFLGEPELGLGELRPGRDEGLLVVVGIDLQQDVSLLEEPSHREGRRHLEHGPRNLRHELAGGPRLHRALARHGEVDALERDRLHPHRGRRHHRGQRLHRRAVRPHDEGRGEGDAEHEEREQGLEHPSEHG